MTRQQKKNDELCRLTAYFGVAGIVVAPNNIEQRERPDFLVTIDDATVGVEVTDYHMEGNRREVEEHWRQLRQWPMLLNDYPKHRRVQLHFKKMLLPPRREVHQFVSEVIGLVAPRPGAPEMLVIDPDQHPVLAKYVSCIEVAYAKPRYTNWLWNFDVAWVGVTEDELLRILESKLASPVQPASSYWLMITEGASLSRIMAFMDHTWLVAMHRLTRQLEQSPFDRLILLQSPIIEWRRDRGWLDFPST